MNRLPAITRGVRFALLAMLLAQAMVLLRSILIARALGPEQYGIAATFILLQQLLDSTSDTGLNKFVLAHSRGHHRSTMATVHAVALSRSILLSFMLLALAWPVFKALDMAESILPFALLAAATLCVGLTQFDAQRMQRRGDFSAASSASIASEAIATVTAAALLIVDQTYIVAIYVIVAKTASTALVSFFLARRPYRIAFDKANARAIWAFSMPLVFNGPLLFFSAQADRLVAATLLVPQALGVYTAALLLAFSPTQLFARYLGTIFLPKLSLEVREVGRHSPLFAKVVAGSAIVIALGFGLVGQKAITIFFGQRYHLAWPVVMVIGTTQALRFSRVWSSTVALAYGVTGRILAANAVRLVTLPLCWAGMWALGGVLGLSLGAMAGEAIALAFASWSIRHAIHLRRKREV